VLGVAKEVRLPENASCTPVTPCEDAGIRIERTRHPKSVHGKPKKVQGKKKAGHGDRPALSVWHGNQGMAAVRLKNKGMTITVVHASGVSLYYIIIEG
jgi:hypothetical protein